eukprot:15430470-Alexandrium_andersonii.AAC.1
MGSRIAAHIAPSQEGSARPSPGPREVPPARSPAYVVATLKFYPQDDAEPPKRGFIRLGGSASSCG